MIAAVRVERTLAEPPCARPRLDPHDTHRLLRTPQGRRLLDIGARLVVGGLSPLSVERLLSAACRDRGVRLLTLNAFDTLEPRMQGAFQDALLRVLPQVIGEGMGVGRGPC